MNTLAKRALLALALLSAPAAYAVTAALPAACTMCGDHCCCPDCDGCADGTCPMRCCDDGTCAMR